MKTKIKNLLTTVMLILSMCISPVAQATQAYPATKESTSKSAKLSDLQLLEQYIKQATYWALINSPNYFCLSEKEITLKVGESRQIKVLPQWLAKEMGWELSKVTTSNKKHVGLYGKEKENLTINVKGKQAGYIEIIKFYFENPEWKKWKKYTKVREKVLPLKVTVVDEVPEEELKDYDYSSWHFDENTLEFVADGKIHCPDLLNVPEDVEQVWSTEGESKPGRYKVNVSFRVRAGYKTPPDMEVEFVITSNENTGNNSNSGNTSSNTGNGSTGGSQTGGTTGGGSSSDNDQNGGDSGEQKPDENPGENDSSGDNSGENKPEIPELKKYDTSEWKFSDISFTYDGNSHKPILSGIPADVEVIWNTEGETNAGTYTAKVSFKVPAGYEDVPDMTTEFVINKAQYDKSKLKFNETTFSYDGKPHAPEISELPEGAKIISSSASNTNVGKYQHEMKIEISPNYEPVTISREYEITPSKLSLGQQYNAETSKIEAIVEGLIDGDSRDLIYTVNGETSSNAPEIIEPGRYEIKTELVLDDDKKQNYTGADDKELQTVLETVYEAKRDNPWYKIYMVTNQEGDKLIVEIFLSDIKVQTQEELGYVSFSLGFDVKYDKDLEFNEFIPEISEEGEGFDGAYNPDRTPSEDIDARDAVLLFFGESIADVVKVCTLIYDVDPSATDVKISLENPTLATGEEDNPFEYTTDSSTIVINPSVDTKTEEILIDWDPQKDATFQGDEEDEAEARENLQDYIDENLCASAVTSSSDAVSYSEVQSVDEEESSDMETIADTDESTGNGSDDEVDNASDNESTIGKESNEGTESDDTEENKDTKK